MKAVIFAAGLGTRLRPLTETVPKPLIEIGGQPILSRTLDALPASVSETTVVVGHLGGLVREALAGRPGVRFVEQTTPRGTYDALLRALPHLDGPFLALNGDDLYAQDDLARLAEAEPFAMLTHEVPTPNPYSHLDVEGGFLKRIVVNAASASLPSRRIYTGACLLDSRFFDLEPAMTPGGELGLPHTLAKHLNKFPVRLIDATFWMPVGTPEELEAARRAFGG